MAQGSTDDAGAGPRDDRCWSRSLVSGRRRADHSRTERPCGNRPVVSPAETGRLRATMGIPSLFTSLVADGLTGRGGYEAAPDMPDLQRALCLACLPGTLLFGQMSAHDEQAHVPNTCGQQKPAAAEEPGDTIVALSNIKDVMLLFMPWTDHDQTQTARARIRHRPLPHSHWPSVRPVNGARPARGLADRRPPGHYPARRAAGRERDRGVFTAQIRNPHTRAAYARP